jgi:hypothetical protein
MSPIAAVRHNWQMVLGKKYDKEKKEFKYEDWDTLIHQFREPETYQKVSLHKRHVAQEEHIKPTEQKRRINSRKEHARSVKQLNDLSSYIKFIRDHEADMK